MRMKPQSPDFSIFITVLALLTFGIIMVLSASSVKASYMYNDPYYFFKRQVIWTFIGLSAMFFIMRSNYQKLRKYDLWFLGISLALLAAVLIPGVGKEILGSRRWIGVGSMSIQPSELVKLAVVLFLASRLSQYSYKIDDFRQGLAPYLGLMGLIALLIMLQPDLGTTIAVCSTIYIMLYVAGANRWHMGMLAVVGLAAVAVLAIIEPYRMRRITGFLDPWSDPVGTGFQLLQSLFALGSGGLFGVGLGQSKQKYFYLPEQHTDFIYAILGEEFGMMGTVAIVLLFFVLVWRGVKVAISCTDAFGTLLAVGVTFMIGVQAMINMGVVTGLLPVTGITLPFLSYGGSSLLFTLAGVGILLSVSRYSNR